MTMCMVQTWYVSSLPERLVLPLSVSPYNIQWRSQFFT
jgi:hypothetical protein